MKLPRDVNGRDLIKSLKKFGYEPTRQKGSHIRLTTKINGEHHVTIPEHTPLKIGTLNDILNDIANHLQMDRKSLIESLDL